MATVATAGVALANGTILYPGMRGATFELYNFSYASFADLARLGSGTLTVEATNGSRSTLGGGTWETPAELYATARYCDRSRAFFRPPVTGAYTFWLSADDVAQLNGTWVMVRRGGERGEGGGRGGG